MSNADGPFGSNVDVPFSNAALFFVSVCGFAMLCGTIYSLILTRLKSNEELDKEVGDSEDYESMLRRADVSTLTRAERRARAHAIMKEKRRVETNNNAEGEGEEPLHPQDGTLLSRKERIRAAKAAEREERKLFESERIEKQRKAQEEARREKKLREEVEASLLDMEEKRIREEREAEENAALEQYNTFLSTPVHSQSVDDWVAEVSRKQCITLDDTAAVFGVEPNDVRDRIQQLIKEERIAGVIDNNERFLFLTHQQMEEIARAVVDRGSVTLSGVSEIVERVLSTA